MKPVLYKLLTSIVLVFLLVGCEREATNIKLPVIEPKLVVVSFISPQDTLLTVEVTETQPVFGKIKDEDRDRPKKVENATVKLTDGVNTVQLVYRGDILRYTTDAKNFLIEPGKTYFLTVAVPDGRKVEASCTVPSTAIQILSVKKDSALVNAYGDKYMDRFVTFTWQDINGQSNFYRVVARKEFKQPDGEGKIVTYNEPLIVENPYLSDKDRDGNIFKTSKISYFHDYIGSNFDYYNSFKIHLFVLLTDESYYKYHQSVINQGRVNENPFAEPVFIYSNVTGGLGVFSAFNQTVEVVVIK